MIRRNCNANDLQRSAENEAKACHEACCKLLGVTPQVMYTNGGVTADCIGSRLTLPKFHLATLIEFLSSSCYLIKILCLFFQHGATLTYETQINISQGLMHYLSMV